MNTNENGGTLYWTTQPIGMQLLQIRSLHLMNSTTYTHTFPPFSSLEISLKSVFVHKLTKFTEDLYNSLGSAETNEHQFKNQQLQLMNHLLQLKVRSFFYWKTNKTLECDVGHDWIKLKWGSGEACFKYMGSYPRPEAAAICRGVGGQLPLPKNDEENEDFQSPYIRGKLTDATDLDGDGIWHDSYGNEVTYFAPLWYYSIENLQGGPWTYSYMSGSRSMFLTPEPENADFVWTVYPNLGQIGVTCQIPLAPPKSPVPEPPTPVEGKIKSLVDI